MHTSCASWWGICGTRHGGGHEALSLLWPGWRGFGLLEGPALLQTLLQGQGKALAGGAVAASAAKNRMAARAVARGADQDIGGKLRCRRQGGLPGQDVAVCCGLLTRGAISNE